MIETDPDASLLREWMSEMEGGAISSGANEYDLKIAVVRAAVALTLRQERSVGGDARSEDRQYAIGLIRALSRAVGLGQAD